MVIRKVCDNKPTYKYKTVSQFISSYSCESKFKIIENNNAKNRMK